MIQIVGLALLSALVILLLRELRPCFAAPARLGVTVLLFGAAMPLYVRVLKRVEQLFSVTGAEAYASVLLRAAGVALICELTATLCRDLGENGVAGGVQLFGKLEILVLSLPLVDDVLEIAKELLRF